MDFSEDGSIKNYREMPLFKKGQEIKVEELAIFTRNAIRNQIGSRSKNSKKYNERGKNDVEIFRRSIENSTNK